MVARIQILRSVTPGSRPASKQYGEPYVNMGDNQFGVFDSSNVARDLIGVPIFSASTSYIKGAPVNYQGVFYVSTQAVSAGAWNPAQWVQGGGGGAVIADTPPSSPTAGELWWESDTGILWLYYGTQWIAVGSSGGGSVFSLGGLLTYVSTTQLKFAPYGGNGIRLNGAIRAIPTAGIAGLGNTSVFVNGTTGQNLAANTTYWIFCFDNAGTLTADFRTAATHTQSATAGNEGTEILTGDDTRSLIGQCRTNASSQFVDSLTQRYVRTWFNRRPRALQNTDTSQRTSNSATNVELAGGSLRLEFLIWADEVFTGSIVGSCYITSSSNAYTGICFNGSMSPSETQMVNQNGSQTDCSQSAEVSLAEGYNYMCAVIAASGGVTAFWATSTGPYTKLYGRIAN